MSWPATEPIGVPLKYETVDVDIIGVRKGDRKRRFTLDEHAFTWVRHGEAGLLDEHAWFTEEAIGDSLAGELQDWRKELWNAGLGRLFMMSVSTSA